MGRVIDGINNVKIFVLYLMENINYPLDFLTINDIVMQTDYVMYIDFKEAFNAMLDDSLIYIADRNIDGDELYAVTQRGKIVADELHSEILSAILNDSMTWALRYIDFKKRGIECKCSYEMLPDERFRVTGILFEKKIEIYRLAVIVDSEARAKQMKENFYNRPEAIYRGGIALMAGQVNYLFDK